MASSQTVIDQELAQFGWIDSVATNSISDFNSTNVEDSNDEEKSDFIDAYICHLIFFAIYCYSLFIYIAIDLGFGLLKKITTFMKFDQKIKITYFEPIVRNNSH